MTVTSQGAVVEDAPVFDFFFVTVGDYFGFFGRCGGFLWLRGDVFGHVVLLARGSCHYLATNLQNSKDVQYGND
jgi:hypothetical protein